MWWDLGATEEQQIRRQIGKLRRAAIHRSGYFGKTIKRWCTGLISQDAPQPPIGGTQRVLNHIARGPYYDPTYRKEVIKKHVCKRMCDNRESTWDELRGASAHRSRNAQDLMVSPHICYIICPTTCSFICTGAYWTYAGETKCHILG